MTSRRIYEKIHKLWRYSTVVFAINSQRGSRMNFSSSFSRGKAFIRGVKKKRKRDREEERKNRGRERAEVSLRLQIFH